ncbi:hypothetical protein HMPREF9422_1304 [Streptococcus cristatus ATCC 51100]|nr:hypothetical protein HMPREF9422_1304 [Streptococcus cristatus ATCC 51100]
MSLHIKVYQEENLVFSSFFASLDGGGAVRIQLEVSEIHFVAISNQQLRKELPSEQMAHFLILYGY